MRGMSATGSHRGFTLLELLVVMSVLVLMAAVFPWVLQRALPGRRVASSTERLLATVHEAQAASVVRGRPVTLRIQEHGLVVVGEKEVTSSRRVEFPSSMQISLEDSAGHPAAVVVLFPDGSARGGRFELRDGAHRGSVRVSELTGSAVLEAAVTGS